MDPSPYFNPSWMNIDKKIRGYNGDGRKIPLSLFLMINDLSEFQRDFISKVFRTTATLDDLAAGIEMLSKQYDFLKGNGWHPNKVEGDAVVRPHHYDRFPIEPTFFNEENNMSWCLGNVLKYVCRYPYKNGLEDLRKAMRYLSMHIKYLQGLDGWSK